MDYKDLLNVKFKTHGRSVEEGFDCYGLAIEVLKRNKIKLPDVFYSDIKEEQIFSVLFNGIPNIRIEKPIENCIILFESKSSVSHVGIYLGSGKFIHATENKGVIIEPLRNWIKKVKGYYKVCC